MTAFEINATNFQEMLTSANNFVSGAMGIIFLMLVYIIIFFHIEKRYQMFTAFFITFALTFPLATILALLNLINYSTLIFYMLMLSTSAIASLIKRRYD